MLNKQVEDLTRRRHSGKGHGYRACHVGVAVSIGLAMVRVLTGLIDPVVS